jgi:hypothetical protein
VVPVNHGPFDGFEGYGVRAALAQASGREVAPLSGTEAQQALARETLAAVREETLALEDGAMPWSAFWAEPATHAPGAFGDYGAEVGNAFGQAQVRWQGRAHRVAPEGYQRFMAARTAGAVAYTRAFLAWASDRFEEAAASPSSAPLAGFRPTPEVSLEGVGGVVEDSRGTTPVWGLRAALPLPRSLGLSVERTARVGGRRPGEPAGSWALSVLSPPLWTARPAYGLGLDVRATAGVGLYAREGGMRPGVPVGLRARASVGRPLTVSAEVLYQGVAPGAGEGWSHGLGLSVGLGVALGDR